MHVSIFGISSDQATIQSFSLGQAVTAATFSEASLKNPAALSHASQQQLSINAGSFFENNVQTLLLSWTLPFKRVGFQAQIPTRLINDIPTTIKDDNNQAQKIGTFQELSLFPTLTTSLTLTQSLRLGVNAQAQSVKLNGIMADGYNIDVGAQFHKPKTTVGVSVKHVLHKLEWASHTETYQKEFNVGLSHQFSRYTLLSDIEMTQTRDPFVNVGGLIKFSEQLSTLVGLNHIAHTPTFRLGILIKITGVTFQYAYAMHQKLGLTHKFGMSFNY